MADYKALITIAAELAQKKPLRKLDVLEENAGRVVGRAAFSTALDDAGDRLGDMAMRLRNAADARPLVGQDADARDAARYRWLRNVAVWATTDRDSVWCVTGTRHEDASPTYGDAMDAAIDAARSQEGDAK